MHLVFRSHWAVPLPSAKRLGAHVGGYEVAVSQSSWSTQKVSQAVGDTSGRVAAPLLCCCITYNHERETYTHTVWHGLLGDYKTMGHN